ncbi:MAG: hypothetical protein ACQESJ_05380 [Bacteroidota bacterium]
MAEMKKISGEDFKKLLRTNSEPTGYIVTDPILLNHSCIHFDSYFFKSCTFSEGIFINIEKEAIEIYLKDVEVKNISVENSTINALHLSGTEVLGSLCLRKTTIKETLELINNSNVYEQIEIELYTQIKSLRIEKSNVENILNLVNTSITTIKINESKFTERVIIMNSFFDKFNIISSKFENTIDFAVCETNSIVIRNSNFFEFILSLSLSNETEGKDIQKCCKNIDIINSSFKKKFIIEDEITKSEKIPVNSLNIFFGEEMKGELYIKSIDLKFLNLFGSNYETEVVFDETKVNKVNFRNFSNYRTLSFFKLEPISTKNTNQLHITKTNLGKTQFHYCDLAAYKENIEIDQSNLIDIIPTGVKWFDYNSLRGKNIKEYNKWVKFWEKNKNLFLYAFYNLTSDDPDVIKYRKIRELFRQLKTVMERQANRIQALQFKQYEMQAYKEELKRTKRFYSRERIVLWANASNNHGQNWVKPILLAIGFSLILCSFITFSVFEDWWSLKTIGENIQHYPRMMNPAFSLENIFGEDKSFSFCTNLWALLQRVSMSFFIYQTVVAFRKYGKG